MRHPLHPALVHFPIACWGLATAADLTGFLFADRVWKLAGTLLVIGISTAIPAMLAGMWDLVRIENDSPSRVVAGRHAVLAITAFTLYAITLVTRLGPNGIGPPGILDLWISIGGLLVLLATGWLGGKLVYVHGVGTSQPSQSSSNVSA